MSLRVAEKNMNRLSLLPSVSDHRRRQLIEIICIGGIAYVIFELFAYSHTMAEPDMARMMMAFNYGAMTQKHLAAGFHYGSSFSFGYYDIIYSLFSDNVLNDPVHTAEILNRIAGISAIMLAVSMLAYMQNLLGSARGLFVTISFLGSPVCALQARFSSGGRFHPDKCRWVR